ncbi:MAG: hypothetical protein V3T31_10610, partial [candidate division Zixibacteria bacterium]
IYVDGDVAAGDDAAGFQDDICGFRQTFFQSVIVPRPTMQLCYYLDTVNAAWISDADGDLNATGLFAQPVPDVTATRIIRTPQEELDVSFNWWVSNGNAALDFGPMSINEYRDLSTGGVGTPEGDRNKYHFLKNNEFDYDQVYTAAIQPTDPTWLYPPPAISVDISDGYDTRYLISFGPFNIDPGQKLPLSFSYLGGRFMHTFEDNVSSNLAAGSYNPDNYYRNLRFDDLSTNSRWADWVYDNPGVDTDGDGDFGDLAWCLDADAYFEDGSFDTSFSYTNDAPYIRGDGVPDFRGASPPPAPKIWVEATTHEVTVRFNGSMSENTPDMFLSLLGGEPLDFEGYRVWYSLDERSESFVALASFDVEDYLMWRYGGVDTGWVSFGSPVRMTLLDSLLDSDPNWVAGDPSNYTETRPYFVPADRAKELRGVDLRNQAVYFVPQDYNRSEMGVTSSIMRRYPNAPFPPSVDTGDYIPPDDSLDIYLTTEAPDAFGKYLVPGLPGDYKCYEYYYVLENLLPTVPYLFNVTSFDYGSVESDLPSLETSKTVRFKRAYPLPTYNEVQEKKLQVYIWPNPYRLDHDYLGAGFEGRDWHLSGPPIADRVRQVNFANLPPKCLISIYSIDGDLVDSFEHDEDPLDATATIGQWDMITRNTQMVVSGIYYWVVEDRESPDVQMGKLVVIM